MLKRRARSDSPHQEPRHKGRSALSPSASTKRARLQSHFQSLSDELVLKVLSFLTTSDLTRCQRVCRRLNRIAGDDQVWKSAFYERFVLPRVLKLPGLPRGNNSQAGFNAHYPRSSKWLDDLGLMKAPSTRWKQLYRLRHNWNRGSCEITEIGISPVSSEPPLCVQMRMGIVFTADLLTGLQAWRLEGEQNLIAAISLAPPASTTRDDRSTLMVVPSALTVDDFENENPKDVINIAVAFSNGAFTIFQLNMQASAFIPIYNHPTGYESRITAMAFSGFHLITMNLQQDFFLYHFKPERKQEQDMLSFGTPQVVTSLKSHTVWPPVSLSIRHSIHGIFACIVYAVPTFSHGWSVAIQELQLNSDSTSIQRSRTATSIPQGFYRIPEENSLGESIYASATSPSQPTSLSYSHPYLLTAHTDNTLTVYLVKSTNEGLEIAPGQQLFGHTSAVSGARIGSRGRAVSISARGSELRVWELEGTFPGNRRGREGIGSRLESIKVYPSPPQAFLSTSLSLNLAGSPLSSPESHWRGSTGLDRWLGFNNEKVIVHREKETGGQVLMVYDFS